MFAFQFCCITAVLVSVVVLERSVASERSQTHEARERYCSFQMRRLVWMLRQHVTLQIARPPLDLLASAVGKRAFSRCWALQNGFQLPVDCLQVRLLICAQILQPNVTNEQQSRQTIGLRSDPEGPEASDSEADIENCYSLHHAKNKLITTARDTLA